MKYAKRLVSMHRGILIGMIAVLIIAALIFSWASVEAAPTAQLSPADVEAIIQNAIAQANAEDSLLRVDQNGNTQKTKMHIVIVDRSGKILGLNSMSDAWVGSIDIAKAKAYTAMAFSSDENALTTRSIGLLSQPGGPLWHIGNSNQPKPGEGNIKEQGIIEFPGGIPLYKNSKLVGGIGVSGDGVDQDENVAEAGAIGYEPPPCIRIDCVLGTPGLYTDGALYTDCAACQ